MSCALQPLNVSFNRKSLGLLNQDLKNKDQQITAVATVIRAVQPDIILLNEVDYQAEEDNAALFADLYLADTAIDALGNGPRKMPYRYSAPVNTGVDSLLDINGNGKAHEPEDAWGYGAFPGQYGMAVLSRYPIQANQVRTFQTLKWSAMPKALVPRDPKTESPTMLTTFGSSLRLSSKSFWDVPIETPTGIISILASHPTPPAFDGPADHNGCRNHDEVRLVTDYIDQDPDKYLVDDQGKAGGINSGREFVVLGDLNSDPIDGDSRHQAIERLIKHPRIHANVLPESAGAVEAHERKGKANARHKSPAKYDTSDFSDNVVGNLRVDYALPSSNLKLQASGVFWLSEQTAGLDAPLIKKLMDASIITWSGSM